MDNAKWYKPLLEKVYDSYSERIIVFENLKGTMKAGQ